MDSKTVNSSLLDIQIGAHSLAGIKAVNEDAVDFCLPDNEYLLQSKGIAFAIADGVSSAEAGREASHYATKTFIQEYFQTPDTWSVKHAGEKTLSSININLFNKSHAFAQQEKGFLCTFISVVIKSRTAHFFHAGDSRLFLIRNGECKQITRDHSVNIGGGKNILARAVGMDNTLQLDYGKFAVEENDILFASTDGLHEFVDKQTVLSLATSNQSAQSICTNLVNLALKNNSDDNVSCVLANILQLPNQSIDDYNAKLIRLPFPPDLSPGMTLDGFHVDKVLFASSRSQIYLVTDTESQQQLVMKTPSLNFEDDLHYIDRFIQEEWIGKRIRSDHVVKIISQNRERTCLYYLMEQVAGISLDKWMEANPLPSPKQAIGIVKQIADALQAFHRADTIHQDLKPANIMIDNNMQVKVIDFGSVFVAGVAEVFVPLEHIGALGTATYSDPHYIQGKNSGVQGDIYSLATITYELFTGHLPYTRDIEECASSGDFDKLRYVPATLYNPIIPIWFDRALQKGCQLQLNKRYSRLDELMKDLTHPNPVFLMDDPQVDNNKGLLFWQLMSAFWVVMLIIVVVLFSAS